MDHVHWPPIIGDLRKPYCQVISYVSTNHDNNIFVKRSSWDESAVLFVWTLNLHVFCGNFWMIDDAAECFRAWMSICFCGQTSYSCHEICRTLTVALTSTPTKYGTFNQCCFNFGPPSTTLTQHHANIGSTFCWAPGQRGDNIDLTSGHCVGLVSRWLSTFTNHCALSRKNDKR